MGNCHLCGSSNTWNLDLYTMACRDCMNAWVAEASIQGDINPDQDKRDKELESEFWRGEMPGWTMVGPIGRL